MYISALLEENELNKLFFDVSNRVIVQTRLMMNGGAIVAQTIINTLSSAKNAPTVRDLEIHQVKKGNDWQLGMKRCFDVDAGSGLGHIMTVTVANEYDITETGKFLRKDDAVVYGNSGHLGVQKRHQICWNRHLLASHINRRHK